VDNHPTTAEITCESRGKATRGPTNQLTNSRLARRGRQAHNTKKVVTERAGWCRKRDSNPRPRHYDRHFFHCSCVSSRRIHAPNGLHGSAPLNEESSLCPSETSTYLRYRSTAGLVTEISEIVAIQQRNQIDANLFKRSSSAFLAVHYG
jgi:hypothetical protein